MLRRIAALVLAGVSLSLVPMVLARASVDPASHTTAVSAINWLKTTQFTNGGFDASTSTGAETPDAVLAIAENAQTGSSWSTSQASTAVNNVIKSGHDPLNYLDDYADAGLTASKAATLIDDVVAPLGMNASDFDPDGDSSTVDLVGTLNSAFSNGSYGSFLTTLQAAVAKKLAGGSVPAQTITLIRNAQQSSGGWYSDGNSSQPNWDFSTTGKAIQALIAGGVPSNDAAIQRGLTFLAIHQDANGSWQNLSNEEDPNFTAMAIRGITAAGYDVTSSCWRDVADNALTGTQYTSPDDFLRNSQQSDGSIDTPTHGSSTTLATTQSVSALLRQYLPNPRITGLNCVPPTPTTTVKVGGLQSDKKDAYWFMHGDGSYASEVAQVGNLDGGAYRLNSPIVSVSITNSGLGAVAIAGDGGIFAFGTGQYRGASPFHSHIAAIKTTPDDLGYWITTTQGAVANVGVAGNYGDLSSLHLNKPIIGMTSTPDGLGYWLVASDGGIFSFGDAAFYGSTGAMRLNQPVVGMAASPSGHGYWMVASDGGIFAFGDATFSGSMGAIPLNQPIIDMARSSQGGYWMFARDGGVFSFGGAPFLGAPLGTGLFVTAAG